MAHILQVHDPGLKVVDPILDYLPISNYVQALVGRDFTGNSLDFEGRMEKLCQGLQGSSDALMSASMMSTIQTVSTPVGGAGSGIPVKDKTRALNGSDYQLNPKHTPGQPGYNSNAGIEPRNSLDLFGESVPSTAKPDQRFTFDKNTNTLHRFFNDGNGTWHWSGSTNQGANSLTSGGVPIDIRRLLGLPGKGW